MRKQLLNRSAVSVWLISFICLSVFMPLSAQDIQRYEKRARQVTIIQDRYGVPHIYGRTDADVVFGLLYTECLYDFARVERNYLEMLGRQAEAFGDSYLYTDVMMRMIYDSVQAKADYEKCPARMRELLDAFADGVNYYLLKHPGTRPLVLTHFEPWYALMFTDGSVSATETGGIGLEEIKAFYGQDHASVAALSRSPAPAEARETGSNGFAIAPARSADGNAMLYINPHVPYYFRLEVQLVSEQGLNVYGAVTWGQFFIYQGFNQHCGWMHTSSYADVADVYAERVRRNGPGWTYEYEGRQRKVTAKSFVFHYKEADSIRTLLVTGLFTHHGPILANREGKWLSLKEYNRSLEALLEAWEITRANTFADYKKAMDHRANTTNNTVYADDQGNIAYWHGNFMPRRDTRYDWGRPVDGSIKGTEWKGLHGLEEIVHVYNPASGWIQNCNSTPYSLAGGSSPDRHAYPAYMAPDGENFRAVNAVRLLKDAQHWSLDSLIGKGYDRYLAAFDVLLPPLLAAYDRWNGDLSVLEGMSDTIAQRYGVKLAMKEAIDYLRSWDRRSDARSIATTLAVEWGTRMAKYAPKARIPEDVTHIVENVLGEVAASTPQQKLSELATVIVDLQQRYNGRWAIEWGAICRYQRLTGKIEERYADSLPSLPVGLAPSAFGQLPSVQSRVMKATNRRYAYSGNSFVAAVAFGKRVRAKSIVTGGASSDPASPHFTDQAAGLFGGQFKDVLFYIDEVKAGMEKQYHPGEE